MDCFTHALNHAMRYEVGAFWDPNHPAVETGDISTARNQRACGFVDDPLDNGGETKFGVAQNGNPDLNIKALTWQQAQEVYYDRYWRPGGCDQLAEFAPFLAALHFDGCINHGVKRASQFLQEVVGAEPDGRVGDQTLSAVCDAVQHRGEAQVCHGLCDRRERFYKEIVWRKPAQGRFLNGWMRRITEMRQLSTVEENSQ